MSIYVRCHSKTCGEQNVKYIFDIINIDTKEDIIEIHMKEVDESE